MPSPFAGLRIEIRHTANSAVTKQNSRARLNSIVAEGHCQDANHEQGNRAMVGSRQDSVSIPDGSRPSRGSRGYRHPSFCRGKGGTNLQGPMDPQAEQRDHSAGHAAHHTSPSVPKPSLMRGSSAFAEPTRATPSRPQPSPAFRPYLAHRPLRPSRIPSRPRSPGRQPQAMRRPCDMRRPRHPRADRHRPPALPASRFQRRGL